MACAQPGLRGRFRTEGAEGLTAAAGKDVIMVPLCLSMLHLYIFIKGSLVGETSVLRTFRMSGKELVKERVSQRKR